jgi:putative tricarboxylic transport membrane protein
MGNKDIIGGGIFTALGVLIFILTFGFPTLEKGHPGPSLFPRILAILFIFFGGIVLWRGWRTGKGKSESTPEEEIPVPRNYFDPIFVLILIAVYMVLSNWLGFYITSSLILFLMMIKLRVPYLRGLVISILLTLFVDFMFFKILRVPLPTGLFGW